MVSRKSFHSLLKTYTENLSIQKKGSITSFMYGEIKPFRKQIVILIYLVFTLV